MIETLAANILKVIVPPLLAGIVIQILYPDGNAAIIVIRLGSGAIRSLVRRFASYEIVPRNYCTVLQSVCLKYPNKARQTLFSTSALPNAL